MNNTHKKVSLQRELIFLEAFLEEVGLELDPKRRELIGTERTSQGEQQVGHPDTGNTHGGK